MWILIIFPLNFFNPPSPCIRQLLVTENKQKTQPSCKKGNLSGKKATCNEKATWKHNLGCKKRQPGCHFVNKQDPVLFFSWSQFFILKKLPFCFFKLSFFPQKATWLSFWSCVFFLKRQPDNLNKKRQLRLSFWSCLFQKKTTWVAKTAT